MSLLSRIKSTNVFRTAVTQMSQISILCGLITATVIWVDCLSAEHCGLAFVSFAAIVATAVVFVFWLVWLLYVLCGEVRQTPMGPSGYALLEMIDCCLFTYWIGASLFHPIATLWAVPVLAVVWIIAFVIALRDS